MEHSKRMRMYDAMETINMNSKHYIRIHLQYGEHTATLETFTLGNMAGGALLKYYTDFETGCSVEIDNETNTKHAIYDDKDTYYKPGVHKCRQVDKIRFTHPSRPDEILSLEEAEDCIIGIEIFNYEDGIDNHDDLDDNHEE